MTPTMAARSTSVPQPANQAYGHATQDRSIAPPSPSHTIRESKNWHSNPANEIKHSHTRGLQTFCTIRWTILTAVSGTFCFLLFREMGALGVVTGFHIHVARGSQFQGHLTGAYASIEERCWLYPSLSGCGSLLELVTLSDSSFLCLIACLLSQPRHFS